MKETKDKPKKNNTIITGIAGAIIGAIIMFAATKYFSKASSYDQALIEKAIEINSTSPVMIDENTRFDFASALAGNKLQYNFTLVNAMLGAVDTNAVKEFLKPNILKYAKTNPEMEFVRKKNTTLFY